MSGECFGIVHLQGVQEPPAIEEEVLLPQHANIIDGQLRCSFFDLIILKRLIEDQTNQQHDKQQEDSTGHKKEAKPQDINSLLSVH